MSGMLIRYNTIPGGTQYGGTRISTFFKFSTLPTIKTIFIDCNSGATGYFRIYWDSTTNKVKSEAAYLGNTMSLDLTPSYTVSPNAWYWISSMIGPAHPTIWEFWDMYSQIWGPGGVTAGTQLATLNLGQFGPVDVSSGVGWGVPLTAYNAFPNTAGNVMAELCVERFTTGLINVRTPPAGPLSPGGSIEALYNCNEALGSNRTLLDATTNHYDMAVGSQG